VTERDPKHGPGAGPADPAAAYRLRRDAALREAARLGRRSRRLSWARLAVAAAGVFALARLLLDAGAPPAWPAVAAAAAAVAFAALAVAHARVIEDERGRAARAEINTQGLARLGRRWDELPAAPHPSPSLLAELGGAAGAGPASAARPSGASAEDRSAGAGAVASPAPRADAAAEDGAGPRLPPIARDLGLFGPASLARLLSTPRTPAGRQTLCRWLLAPAAPDEAAARQQAVAELAPALDFRQELELAGAGPSLPSRTRTAGNGVEPAGPMAGSAPAAGPPPAAGRDPAGFLAWADEEPWLLRRPAVVAASRALPPLAWALGAAALAGLVPGAVAALALVGNLGFTWALKRRIDERLDRVAAGAEELAAYAGALRAAAGASFSAPRLAALAADLAAGGEPAWRWMDRLRRRVEIADARHGSFHVVNQVLTLWDFHALWLVERWQAAAGGRVRRWLAALGELEALSALAALAHDQPGWAFPELDAEGPAVLAARELGHPLLADEVRVGNDVEVGPPGTFLLVTGSNMSGKSTLLRALGVNAVLAQAGGPVCARAMRLPPLVVGTSVLVEDSLADGVSFFLAELRRLKGVVDLAARAEREGRVLLFLLDEVLRGTNSRERREAVRRVLAHLMERPAIGALSTHDLELGGVPEIARAAVPVHFRETVAPPGAPGPPMTFDYRLRPGPATTTNALRLLAAVGLGGGGPASGGAA